MSDGLKGKEMDKEKFKKKEKTEVQSIDKNKKEGFVFTHRSWKNEHGLSSYFTEFSKPVQEYLPSWQD